MMKRIIQPFFLLPLVFAGVAWLYLPALNGPYLFDDHFNLKFTLEADQSFQDLAEVVTSNQSGIFGRVVPMTTFVANYYFFGPGAYSFKVVNLIIHLLIGAAIYWLTLRTTSLVSSSSVKTHQAPWFALLISAFWLFHPLHVSTTMYIVQRMAQLSALFVVIAILLYIFGRHALNRGSNTKALLFLLLGVPIFGVLGLLSKENAVLLPVLLLVVEACLFKFRLDQGSKATLWTVLAILIVIPLVLGVVYFVLLFDQITIGYEVRSFSLSDRLATQLVAVAFYVKLVMLPRLSDMGIFHDDFPVYAWGDPIVFACLAFHAGLLFAAFKLWRSHAIASLGILFFYAAHLLESTVIPLEMVMEHRNYLASWGLMLTFGYLVFHFFNRKTFRATVRMTVISLVTIATFVVLPLMLSARANIWANDMTLFSMQQIDHPKSTRNLGWLAQKLTTLGRYDEAFAHIAQAENIKPHEASLTLQRIFTKCRAGKLITVQDFNAVMDKLRRYPVSAATINMTAHIANQVGVGGCVGLSNRELLEFTELLVEKSSNDRLRASLMLEGNLSVGLDQAHRALAAYQRIADDPSASFFQKKEALIGVAKSQARLCDVENAKQTINTLRALDEQSIRADLKNRLEIIDSDLNLCTDGTS